MVFHPTWSEWMWVLTTTSTAARSTPAERSAARKPVFNWSRGGMWGRWRSLPTPVSTTTVNPSTSMIQLWIAMCH